MHQQSRREETARLAAAREAADRDGDQGATITRLWKGAASSRNTDRRPIRP
jgi:hypothetical protein